MRICLKILAAPAMCLLAIIVAICSVVLLIAGFIGWFLAVAAGIGGVVLLVTQHPAGGIAFLVIAFLLSPYGIPAFVAWLIGKLNVVRISLKGYIFS
jgi:hypothetical protein